MRSLVFWLSGFCAGWGAGRIMLRRWYRRELIELRKLIPDPDRLKAAEEQTARLVQELIDRIKR